MKYVSIDIFSGVGGLTTGMHKAGFQTKIAVELDSYAVKAYKMNHKKTKVIEDDIRKINISLIKKELNGSPLHLLAGCPPCQGFSSVRRLNKKRSVRDDRNNLVLEFLRFVKGLKPITIMMENVPGLTNYTLFKKLVRELNDLGYNPKYDIVNVKDYGVPQSRKRLVLVGSLLGDDLNIAEKSKQRSNVKKTIGKLKLPEESIDPLHKNFSKHTPKVIERICKTPHNGGSWKDLPEEFHLECHKRENVGFNDIYGRLRWDDFSTTITGGCLNPSKGRFLHPEQDRVLTPREAALLQSFPKNYKFPLDIPKAALALLIGNALPPRFSYYQSLNIRNHLVKHLG